MYIKNNMTDTEGFALDTARIGNTSTSKTKIVLPTRSICSWLRLYNFGLSVLL